MTRASNDYAYALFSLACEADARGEWAQALELVDRIFREQPEYLAFLSSPSIQISERVAALTAAFEGSVPEQVLSFLCILCERGVIRSVHECIEEYTRMYQESERVCVALVRSAVPLSEGQQAALKEKLSRMCNKSVTLSCTVDTALIGGMTVELDGKILDGSLKHRLNEVKEVIHH